MHRATDFAAIPYPERACSVNGKPIEEPGSILYVHLGDFTNWLSNSESAPGSKLINHNLLHLTKSVSMS